MEKYFRLESCSVLLLVRSGEEREGLYMWELPQGFSSVEKADSAWKYADLSHR